jgi:glycosyltransferase involved in cell wall biosynthesis
VDSLRLAREKFPNLQLMAIGLSVAGSKVPLRRALNLCDEDWIIETGRISFDRVGYYLNSCDVLALPMRNSISNAARWPSKLNDYFAAGRPVVATNVGEVRFFGEQAYLTADDPESFQTGIVRVLKSQKEAAALGQAGRALAEGQLNWSQIVSRLEGFYRGLLKPN